MRYFKIEHLGDLRNIKLLAEIDKKPKGLKLKTGSLIKGGPVKALFKDLYPDRVPITLEKKPDNSIGKLTDYISCTCWMMVFTCRCTDVFRQFSPEGETEYISLSLIDNDENIISEEYWLVHPLSVIDALDLDKTDVNYYGENNTDPFGVNGDYFFSAQKVENAPAIFRVSEYPYDVFLREDLVRALNDIEPSNMFLTEIKVI